MDIYVIMQVIILFGAIFLGVRLGGMGIGYAGGLGVVLLSLGMGMFPGQIPWDVILIIMSAIAAICAIIYCRCSESNWYHSESCIGSSSCYEWVP